MSLLMQPSRRRRQGWIACGFWKSFRMERVSELIGGRKGFDLHSMDFPDTLVTCPSASGMDTIFVLAVGCKGSLALFSFGWNFKVGNLIDKNMNKLFLARLPANLNTDSFKVFFLFCFLWC